VVELFQAERVAATRIGAVQERTVLGLFRGHKRRLRSTPFGFDDYRPIATLNVNLDRSHFVCRIATPYAGKSSVVPLTFFPVSRSRQPRCSPEIRCFIGL
jgi:hypothetical protein